MASRAELPVCQDCMFALFGPQFTPVGPVPTYSEIYETHPELHAWLVNGPGLCCVLCRNVASPESWLSIWVHDA